MLQIPLSDTRYLKGGKVTGRLEKDLEKILDSYSELAILFSKQSGRPPMDFIIREVSVVGSILRGVDTSDLDLLMIANSIGQDEYRFFKLYLSSLFYVNRPKEEAIDVYVRPHDEFPDRGSYDITKQVRKILERYNQGISSQISPVSR